MRWTLLGLLLTDVTLHIWGLQLWPGHVDYQRAGSWGDWASGAGALAAVIVALASINAEKKRLAQEEDQRRSEAYNRVFAWAEPEIDSDSGRPRWTVIIENETRFPVFEWSITCEPGSIEMNNDRQGALTPGQTRIALPQTLAVTAGSWVQVYLRFTDMNGTLWVADTSGARKQA